MKAAVGFKKATQSKAALECAPRAARLGQLTLLIPERPGGSTCRLRALQT
jgi:hypothetical protein